MNVNFNDNINNYPLRSTNSTVKDNYTYSPNRENQSFGGFEQFTERLGNKIVASQRTQNLLKNHTFNKLLKTAIENPGLYEAFIALLITCTARPLTILATPGAKMEDKEYAAAQSMASGISGLAMAYAAFGPLSDAVDNILIKVNGKNVNSAFKSFYENPENQDVIAKLAEKKIIPTKEEFSAIADKEKNIFGYFKKYLKENGGKTYIENLLDGDNLKEKEAWTKLVEKYSKGLKSSFEAVKNNGTNARNRYLVHENLEFLKEGAYNLKSSAGAGKTKFLIGGTGKIVFFPILAGITIWAIPKIMHFVFPNRKRSKKVELMLAKQNPSLQNSIDKNNIKHTTFMKFNNKPASVQKQVSFAGGLKVVNNVYQTVYKKPVSSLFAKILEKITFSKTYSNRINTLMENDNIKKHGLEVLARDKSGKIMSKWDNDIYASYLPQIAGLFGSALYIFNTIRNKEIDPERKPALCTNMAVVAIFSFFAGKWIDKVSAPIFDALKKTHSSLMKNKLNYDHEAAWKCAKSLLTTTFAFRYLGPVLATPTADKLVRLFNNNPPPHHHKK